MKFWRRRLATSFLTCFACPTLSWAALSTGFAWQKSGRFLASLIYFAFFIAVSFSYAEENVSLKRIRAHLMIADPQAACNEAAAALAEDPCNSELIEIYIKALAELKNEKKMIETAQDYFVRFPGAKDKRDILEHISWGVIENAALSDAPQIRLYALIGAFFANDAKGVRIIQKSLADSNWLLRGVATQISSELRDLNLCNKMLCLAKNESNFVVRLESIRALGQMKIARAKSILEEIIINENSEYEEKILAIKSLATLIESAKREDIERLSKSSRFGFRLLACELVLERELSQEIDLIIPLLQDNRREVRRAALETIGILRISCFEGKSILDKVIPLLNDIDDTVSVTAAFVTVLNDKELGQKAFRNYFKHESKEIRLLASAALAKSGKYGMPLTEEVFKEAEDLFVKMNLSVGLIGQREMIGDSCQALYEGLTGQLGQLAWVEKGIFKYLAPAKMQMEEFIPNEREAKNQLARLEILNILCIMKHAQAEDAIKQFLQEHTWGISAMASLLLLSEGDESAIYLVENLLNDPNEKIRIQAALVLSLWDSGSAGLEVLQASYAQADREMKENILEAIGRVGQPSSIPFLLSCLNEPFQSLRVIAASALLQTLYH